MSGVTSAGERTGAGGDDRCPVCRNSGLTPFFSAEGVPVFCNVLWSTEQAAREAARGDVHLGFCPSCAMIFNLAFDPGRVSYSPEYENSLHCSDRFQEYAEALAGGLVEAHGLRGKDVLEIGCGKGDFLTLVCSKGNNRGMGFDASYDDRQNGARAENIVFVKDHFSAAYAHYAADLVCCRHVLEHIPEPVGFLRQVRRLAGNRQGAVVFFEVPNVLYTLRDLGIWDIIYEHCSYFSPPSIRRLFLEAGFAPSQPYSAYGEQFLCIEATVRRDGGDVTTEPSASVEEMGILVQGFADHYREKVGRWSTALRALEGEGKAAAVWGGGSKGVTFLNTVEGSRAVRCVVDINPRKQDCFVAGTGHPIVGPERLREFGVELVLVMNPVYEAEIRGMLKRLDVDAELRAV